MMSKLIAIVIIRVKKVKGGMKKKIIYHEIDGWEKFTLVYYVF